MTSKALQELLHAYKDGVLDEASVLATLKKLPYEELGFAKVDHHRALRQGYPEAIYCAGKTPDQIEEISRRLLSFDVPGILATRADGAAAEAVLRAAPDGVYHEAARMVTVTRRALHRPGLVCVVAAGTADMPVSEEAAITVTQLGYEVDRLYDVGVAGIHRLLSQTDRLLRADVLIVVAGMEGALASVVGGLVSSPVVAVPTSVGYGASFGGLASLLTMLNSCAAGLAVVNIDNGFGAAFLAGRILGRGHLS